MKLPRARRCYDFRISDSFFLSQSPIVPDLMMSSLKDLSGNASPKLELQLLHAKILDMKKADETCILFEFTDGAAYTLKFEQGKMVFDKQDKEAK